MAAECRLTDAEAQPADTRRDARVAELAAEEWGVLSIYELRGCGLSDQAVRTRVRRGWLHRMHLGVYAVGHANPPLEGRFLAAVKACGDRAVLSHLSAAALFGILPWEERLLEVTVIGSAPRALPGIRMHRTGALDVRDIARRRGVPCTSPVRTLIDLAAVVGYRPLRRAVRQAQAVHLVNLRQLAEALARLGPRRGVRNLRRIMATGPAPTQSELEDVVLDLMLQGGFRHPDVNVPLFLGGRRVVPDFRWPDRRLVVEADGAAWHDHRLAREDDAERQALLEAHGERVVRVTWEQAVSRGSETLARLSAAGAPVADPPAHRVSAQ